ncbi:EAL domain-containing protein [Alkalibaculum sp. M08DMB]|uniref:EAL domain-containing protein n=1 Tax=Alkalibaculum sporogenes TaxID=2655001 RepID=A0A6A7KCP2_9FIRM|nr:phosphodiesterase [Alkalibaculum sporogenes]MPW27299.1 EAL domain-containing protein [Alkalibaculum sporogenes]
MKANNKFIKPNVKVFIIPFVLITVLFFIAGQITVTSIKNHYYELKKQEALILSRGYSQNLTKSAQASEIIDKLLDEKLLVASRASVLFSENPSNELFIELADALEIQEIDYYNNRGELIYSNIEELIGWVAPKGHPVHNFMISDSISLVEDIRRDSITGTYYKYAYSKFNNGSFIQVGVRADKINEFFNNFETQQLLNEMNEGVDMIRFIDNNFYVTGSTKLELIGNVITDSQIKSEITENREHSYITNVNGDSVYEVFVPVVFEDNRIGTLAISFSLKETIDIVNKVTLIGLFTLTIIYASLLFIMLSGYKKDNELLQLAYYDLLTGLPNKRYLKVLVDHELNKSEAKQSAILLINCNNFRLINMTFGYEYGDEIIIRLSKDIQDLADDDKIVFRFTADRLILFVRNYNYNEDLITISNKICSLFSQPIEVKGVKQYISVQIGIVRIDSTYNNVAQLLKDASIAINDILDGTCNYAFFNEAMETKLHRNKTIENELRAAIDEKDTSKIYIQYQPLIDLKTNLIIGFEALARMDSDNFGTISPIEFIEIAERKHLIAALGNLILKKACEFSKRLNELGFTEQKIAVNISGIQLLRDDFSNSVINILKECQMKESSLELEITESILLDNFTAINEKLKELQNHKIQIALDDFGTGYSSLYRLGELNLNTLKIDRYFINKITARDENELITGDIISMGHKFGLNVVAEGVELQAQKEYLIENNCDIMQGYLFSRPLLEKDAIEILKMTNGTKSLNK